MRDLSAFGANAPAGNTMGERNNAFGSGALQSNATGAFNNAFGSEALTSNVGNSNTAFGD